ncbi:hypothetical protein K504DRAFT_522521 [Pleomassaria siparia CBS 279.74]|uniref:Uncharacterized protein n=1 Tax=Pleomassaria siparia CBS 279.74 TaxID=1314801 RepID=A0A6G1JR07_9PLEO|nr:hypothetical protein K504DRAFT_522521 [Pleomassaria siparia CBS 279.74]
MCKYALSDKITMPTHAKLCNLNTSPNRGIPVDSNVNCLRKRDTFLFAQRACESRASTNLLYRLYACNAPARALIVLVIIKDVKVASIPAVLITTLSSLKVVA